MANVLARPSLYDGDYLAWTEQQAALLRARRLDEIDVANITEELEDRGRSEWKELENRLEILLVNLLRRDHQPGRRLRGWDMTVDEQRRRIHRLFKRSSSLRRDLTTTLSEIYPDAVRSAARETRLSVKTFPERLPYSVADVLEHDLLP